MTLTVLPPTAVWGLLCAIVVITGAVSPNHGPQKPRSIASRAPWWEILNHVKNKDEIKIPKLSCISSNPSIFNIMQETKDHCTGEDYNVTFYYQNDQRYIELGSLVIDKYLFNNVLKKYSDWSLTNQKLRPINKWNTSKANKGSNDNDKLSNKELNQVLGSYCNRNTQKNVNQDIFEDNECYINQNDKKCININSTFNPKYNYFEVSIPEDIDTSSSPTIINVHIDETNNNMAKNDKVNINYNKGSHSYAQDKNIHSEYQKQFLDDDVYDLDISDIVDLLLNESYEVNLNAPIEFNLENSQDINTIESDIVNTYTARDTADYQKEQQEDYFNNIEAIEPSNNTRLSTLEDNDINQEEQPFYVSTVASDYKYTDTDSNEYIVDTSEDTKYHKDLSKDDDSKSITIDDRNTLCSTYQIKKPLKESENESKFQKNTNFMTNANPETSESLISTQTSPINKEPKPSPSFHVEADSQSPNGDVVEVTPSTSIETLPVNTNKPTYTSIYLPESKSSTIPLTLHELLPLKTTSPALSHTNRTSDFPLPADTSYVSLPSLNHKNQITKDKFKGNIPAFPKNKLWTQKYVQPIEIPSNPDLALSTMKLPTSFTSVAIIYPSPAPKTANFVTQPSMAADYNLNTKADLLKPPSVSQTPVTVSATSTSTPIELSEKCLRQFLQLPEIVTVSLSSPEHTISPSNILLSKIPQVTEASMSTDTVPLIYDDMIKSSKWNDYTPLQGITSSTDSLATTPKKDYTKVLYSQQPIVDLYYKLLQQFPNNKQIPALKNTVSNGMISPMTTKAYFTPNINPDLTTFIPTREEYIDPMLTSIPKLASGSLVSNTVLPILTLDKPTYLTATSIVPKSESTPKEFSQLPHSISGIPINSYTSHLTYSSTPLSISNYWKTIPAAPVKPLNGIFQSALISNRANIISTSPSNFIEPLQSYDTPLIEKFKTQCLYTNLPKPKAVLEPIYEASSDLLLDTTSPNPVSFITPMHTEQMLNRIPITSSLEPLTDQNYIKFARPSSLCNKYNSYTSPCKSNVQYLSTDKPFAVPVTSLPLTVKPIEAASELLLLTDKVTPAWSAFKTTPLPEIPVPLSEICATPLISEEINNFKPIFLNNISTTSSIPLQPENKIPLRSPTMSPLSDSILQSNLLKTLSASPYVILDNKEFNTKTTATSPVLPAPYTCPMLNAKVLNVSPLKCSNYLVSYKKLPTYAFQPKPPDDISMSPVADHATPILSPLNYLSPIKAPCTKPPTTTILTTPLLGEEFTPTSPYTFQPHLPPSYVSPLDSKAAPVHTILSNFVTPLSYSKSPIYEDIPQTSPIYEDMPPISPIKEIFSSRSPLQFAKSSSAASSTPLSQAIHYSPLLAEKVISEAPYVTALSIEKSESIPEPITPMVPFAAYTSPFIGTTMKNPWISLQNQQILYPMLSEYTPLSVTPISILSSLKSKTSQWKPLEHYTLPNLSVDYTPVLEKETIPSIPLSTLTSTLSNPQYLSKQHIPLYPYKHETSSSPQYSVPSLPKSAKHTFWSKPSQYSSQYSEKDIPILHTEYSHGVVSPLLSSDFSSKSKLYSLTYAEPLSDLTPLNIYNLKKSPLKSICSDLKSPTYSTLLSSPIKNQIIPNTLSAPVFNASPVETITQILPSETLTSLPLSVTSNLLRKKVPQIISPLQPPEPQMTPTKALFSNNLQSQLPYKDITNVNKYSSQVTSTIPTLSVSELKDITSVASQTIPYKEPNIITRWMWSPKTNAPTIPNITPCTYTPLACPYSNIAEPITGTPPTGTPLSEISIDTSIINRHNPLFTLKVSSLTKPQLQTLPLDSTVTSLLSKYRLPVLSTELKQTAPVLSANIQENKLSLNAFSPLSPLLLPTVSPCQYEPSSSFLSPVPIKSTYPAEANAQFTTPLNYLQTLKPSTLPTTSISYTSIQPLFIPASYQISSKKPLNLSPSDYAALDIAKHIAPIVPVSNPLQYTDRISGSIIPISPLSELNYVEYTPASSIPINPIGKSFSLIDSAPLLVSPLQPQQLETNSHLTKSPLLPINSLLNLKQDPLLAFVNTPLTPVTISPSVTHVSSPVNLITIHPTLPSPITQPLELRYSPYTTLHQKTSTAIHTLSTVKPFLPKITPAISIQPLFTPKLSVSPAASVTTAMNSLEELHNIIQSGPILSPQIFTTPITPFDSTPPLGNLTSTSPLYSILPKTMQSSPIATSSLHTLLPTPVLSPTSSPVNTVSNANLQFYDPVPLLDPIRYSTPSLFPIRQLPLKYTELTPKMSPYWSFAPCSSIKNTPFSVINSSTLSNPINIPCPIHSVRAFAPTMTPHSLPIFPIHGTFTSAPISYATQPSSPVFKSVLPSLAQQPYGIAKYITPKISPLSTKLNNISVISPTLSIPEIPLAFPCNLNPLNPVLMQFSPISANPKLTNAEYISPSSILSTITPVSIPRLLKYKTLSPTPNYLVSPFSIMKPLMSSPLSESSTESPITVSPIQTPSIQYSTPIFSPLPFRPGLTTPYAPCSLYTGNDPKVVSPIVTKYSNIALDTSKSTPTTTFITPLSYPNCKIISNLQLTPQELNQYMATKSPLKTMKPCYASQTSILTPNYISNLITNTLPISKKPLSFNQYSNIKINSHKKNCPIINVSPLTSIQHKSLQPIVLPITNSIVNPVSESTTVPIKSFLTLSFTELPQSSNPFTLSSRTPFTPISSTLDSPSNPMQCVPSFVPVVPQEVIQPLITNIGTPVSSSTQSSPPKTTLHSSYISLRDNFVTPAEFIQTLQSISSSKVSLSPSNIKKPIMYEQPLPYKLASNRDNFAEYYHNPSYSISSFSNDNIRKPLDSINDEKSLTFKTILHSNSYSNPLTTVPTWKEIPVNPVAQAASIDTRYIDDSMFKIYPLPSNYISCAPNLETLKYESYKNNLKSLMPVINNNIVPQELQNLINNNKNINFDRQSNADISIPLGNMVISNKERNNLITHKITPSIGLRMWPSNVTLVEAKLHLKFKDVTVNNFQSVVNELNTYGVDEIQKQVKDYIRNKYGEVIVIPNNYSLNSQYDVIKDCSSSYDNRCNLLWPAYPQLLAN